MVMSKDIIGRDDTADFPSFGLKGVRVKTDSGAYTSTIHCSKIEETQEGLKIIFLEKDEEGYTGDTMLFKKYERKKVRSSSGEQQERYIVHGTIELFGKKHNTEFTLSSRDLMRYPVLLGRKLLSGNFIIDTALSNLSYEQQKTNNA